MDWEKEELQNSIFERMNTMAKNTLAKTYNPSKMCFEDPKPLLGFFVSQKTLDKIKYDTQHTPSSSKPDRKEYGQEVPCRHTPIYIDNSLPDGNFKPCYDQKELEERLAKIKAVEEL